MIIQEFYYLCAKFYLNQFNVLRSIYLVVNTQTKQTLTFLVLVGLFQHVQNYW